MQIRGSKKASIQSNGNIYRVSCHDPFLKKKKRPLFVCLKGETQKKGGEGVVSALLPVSG
jgi:hypothetical protein